MQDIHPASGWSLNLIVALDVHAPGTAGAFFRASAERRQVIAALLAMLPFPQTRRRQTELAEFLNRASHKDILETAFSNVPNGMRGALARSGPEPHPRSFYRLLFRLLSSEAYGSVATVIKRLDSIDFLRLRVAKRLPRDICTPHLVGLVGSVRAAMDIAKLVDLLSSNGVDRNDLAEAIRRVRSENQLSVLWARWSQKLTLPPHPVAASIHYSPVNTGVELRRLALRYRNCAARYLAEVMQGESAFAEFEYLGKRGVVHLKRAGEAWNLEGMFGVDNGMVAPEVRHAGLRYLAEQGILTEERRLDLEGEWRVLRRLTGIQFFGF